MQKAVLQRSTETDGALHTKLYGGLWGPVDSHGLPQLYGLYGGFDSSMGSTGGFGGLSTAHRFLRTGVTEEAVEAVEL